MSLLRPSISIWSRKALKSFRNGDSSITRPDKENGVVLIDRFDYFSKMEIVVKGRSKYMYLGLANKYVNVNLSNSVSNHHK